MTDHGESVTVSLSGLADQVSPVFTEKNLERTYRFAFVNMPRECLYNDDQCQPRTIKPAHIWSIYSDINRNPLHEAPAVRIEKTPGSQASFRMLLFDGQHKALAFWLAGRDSVATKVYLDLDKDAAIRLVNSVQAKIRKLPLSPFELAAKMTEEWQERVTKYETEVGTESASEDGFTRWVEKDERPRAKQAFVDALFDTVLSEEILTIKSLVSRAGGALDTGVVSEAAFRNKVLRPLLHTAPLVQYFPESQKLRQRERDNVCRLLNLFHDKGFKSESPQEELREKRLVYQSSLAFVTSMIRRLVGHTLSVDSPRELLEKSPDDVQWAKIEKGIDRLLQHPVWVTDFNHSVKMRAVKDALQKNQDAERAFGEVGLKLGYVMGADQVAPNCVD
ncbi:MAG: hypothetical protein R2712_07715 [Vicinamibacterales bacterium]